MSMIKLGLNLIRPSASASANLLIRLQAQKYSTTLKNEKFYRLASNPDKILSGSYVTKKFSQQTSNLQPSNPIVESQNQMNLFKRFKDAYNKHGKVLIIVHLASSVGWISSFYLLSKRYLKYVNALTLMVFYQNQFYFIAAWI